MPLNRSVTSPYFQPVSDYLLRKFGVYFIPRCENSEQ
jgi:hypothetical protein